MYTLTYVWSYIDIVNLSKKFGNFFSLTSFTLVTERQWMRLMSVNTIFSYAWKFTKSFQTFFEGFIKRTLLYTSLFLTPTSVHWKWQDRSVVYTLLTFGHFMKCWLKGDTCSNRHKVYFASHTPGFELQILRATHFKATHSRRAPKATKFRRILWKYRSPRPSQGAGVALSHRGHQRPWPLVNSSPATHTFYSPMVCFVTSHSTVNMFSL